MSTSKILRIAVLVGACLFASRHARAQEDIVGVIDQVYASSLQGLLDRIPPSSLSATFNEEFATNTIGAIRSAFVLETAGFPIGSSSGGFTYFYDATTGGALRSSPSFGPAFAERPLTSGRGRLNLGFTYLHRSFSQVEGVDLEDGSLKFNSVLLFPDGTNADVIESTAKLKLTSDTATFFATYGVMDKLDLSVAIPVQHVSVDTTITSQLVRFGPSSQTFPIAASEASDTHSATGVGDIAVRAKYNLFNGYRAAVAAGMDLRLPTGDEENLLGTGNTRLKLYGAVASKTGRLLPHANFGYTFQSESENSFYFGSEFGYTAGAEYVVSPRLTVVGDLVGRSLADEGRLRLTSRSLLLANAYVTPANVEIFVPAETRTITEFVYEPGARLNTAFGTIGAKFSPASTLIVSGHVLFPVSDAGLKSRMTPVIGVDYTF
jgi:hypothetical protein